MKVTRREFTKSQAAVAAATAGVTLPLSTTAIAKDMQDNAGKPADQLTSRVGMFGSGQWAVWDGYAASKFMKAGLRSNNLDPNARH